jgi:hypothetical protein
MIGRRGFRIVEPPRASPGPFRANTPLAASGNSLLPPWGPEQPCAAAMARARAPPGTSESAGGLKDREQNGGNDPRHGAGPAGAPLAQANQSPPETITERSQP